jgi:hypothetical protein
VNLADKIVMRPIGALIPYASNARTHSDAQIAQIAASIREFGFTNPVLVDGEQGIIAGHGRVLAARKLGMDQIPTIELAYLSETQRQAYIIADNKLAENAGWDAEMLRLELGDLKRPRNVNHFSTGGAARAPETLGLCRCGTAAGALTEGKCWRFYPPVAPLQAMARNQAAILAHQRRRRPTPLLDARGYRGNLGPCVFRVRDQPINPPPLDLVGRPRSLNSGLDSRAGARAAREG